MRCGRSDGDTRMKRLSCATIVVAMLITVRASWAESLLCPPEQSVYLSETDNWHTDYGGYLSEVVISSEGDGTVVSCTRQFGRVTRWFGKACKLGAGESRNKLEITPDEEICFLSSNTENTNDRQCTITCAPELPEPSPQ